MKVIYEDNHLLCVEKPPGTLAQGDETGDTTLLDTAKLYLKEKYEKPGAVYLGLVHRLDRPTGGVLLFCRTSKAAARVSAQFRERQVKKTYLAVCWGKAKAKAELCHHLLVDRERRKTTALDQAKDGSKPARLSYQLLGFREGMSLLKVEPETGRKHQIRAQLSHVGLPIVGDQKYAARKADGGIVGAIALWAHKLELTHPVRREPVVFRSLPDLDVAEPWSTFKRELS
ncbi:MAG: RNA pseudouridine synthase [Candidatus Eremiobacteraeota bacterium]|nr:RNA pseudouridine synthase [Candidatus Eremiobacteraeota bacterium]